MDYMGLVLLPLENRIKKKMKLLQVMSLPSLVLRLGGGFKLQTLNGSPS